MSELATGGVAPPGRAPAPLTPFEIACGGVFRDGSPPPPLSPARGPGPRTVLEAIVAAALRRPPCVVTFSGGRDSSSVLALAVHVARRDGLPEPIAWTLRFRSDPFAEETLWQELTIRHLGLAEWVRGEFDDELDFVGPVAQRALRRHGLLLPSNAFLMLPPIEAAAGGTLLTGIDGDGLFERWRWRALADCRAGRRSAGIQDRLKLAYALAPRALRVAIDRSRIQDGIRWLSPSAEDRYRRARAVEFNDEPLSWDDRVRWYAADPILLRDVDALARLAAPSGTTVCHPFFDPAFLSSMAEHGGRDGFGTRTEIMRMLFGDLLPPLVLERWSKTVIVPGLWGPSSRRLAETWAGAGVDHTLVIAERLRAEWLVASPHGNSSTALQAAWLAGAGSK